jgi:hypothetical protein
MIFQIYKYIQQRPMGAFLMLSFFFAINQMKIKSFCSMICYIDIGGVGYFGHKVKRGTGRNRTDAFKFDLYCC